MYRIVLEHISTKKTYNFNAEDKNNGEKLYFRFQIPLTDVEDGKYKLFVYQDEELIKEDILVIGDFNTETLQYQRGENVYIETKLDAKVEDVVEVTVRDIETVIRPSAEYDVMEKVIVNAQPIYEQGSTDGYNRGTVDGYNDGFNQGKTEGLTQGIEQGKEEQKSKLVPLTVTENGSYSRTDGYSEVNVMVADVNGSYDEGYTDGFDAGKIEGEQVGKEEQKMLMTRTYITRNATYQREDGYNEVEVNVQPETRVLNVTENGCYATELTQPDEIIMPYPETGDDFYSYADVKNLVYNTNIVPNSSTVLEFWYKPDERDKTSDNSMVFGNNNQNIFSFLHRTAGNQNYVAYINQYSNEVKLVDGVWYNIKLSINDGLVVNGEQIGTFNTSLSTDETLFINGQLKDLTNSADGSFGMIKITTDGVENIIVPTENGFKNLTTNEMLPLVYNEGTYKFTKIEKPIIEGNLIRTVNVNVPPKIDVANSGLKFGYSKIAEVPSYLDFSKCTDLSTMFYFCSNLTTIPLIDTSNVTNLEDCFYYCTSLQTIPLINTSNVTNLKKTFMQSSIKTIPLIDTSNVTSMYRLFYGCGSLTEIPPINTSKVIDMDSMFQNCGSLTTLPSLDVSNVTNLSSYFGYSDVKNLTNVGGWINLKINWNDDRGLAKCPNLTYQSCINILNGLADVTDLGSRTLKVHPNFLTTVGDEISIGISKGWTIIA